MNSFFDFELRSFVNLSMQIPRNLKRIHSVRALKSFQESSFIMSHPFLILYELLSSAQLFIKVTVKNNSELFVNKLKKRGPLIEP